MSKFEKFYEKNYKKLLILPAIVLAISLIYLIVFYAQTGDIINKDVSLTGGTTITYFTQENIAELESELSQQLQNYESRTLSDTTGQQIAIVITVPNEQRATLENFLEDYFDELLTEENSSTESTASSLSEEFYKQLITAILVAFFWMAAVVFLIFSKGAKIKTIVIALNIIFGFFMGYFFLSGNNIISTILFLIFAGILVYIYIKNSVPSFAVMFAAFADIVMTLAMVNFLGMKISTAGIVAFLMLIGYSVDTDILLTTRILKKKGTINQELFGAFKTGTTMTLTSLVAIAVALFVVYSFASVLNEIFTILLIGLGFDLLNTWFTNASLIKWYAETRK